MRAYKTLVAEGRRAVETISEANWRLGDLALEVAETGINGAHNGTAEVLATYAEDVGVEVESLRQYRRMAEAWPPGTRVPGASWSVHRVLTPVEGRKTILRRLVKEGRATVTEAHRAATGNAPPSRASVATVAGAVNQVKDLLADPEVRKEVMKDRTTSVAVNQTSHEVAAERVARVERKMRDAAPKLVEASEFYKVLGMLHHARRDARDALKVLRELPPLNAEQRAMLAELLAVVDESWALLAEYRKARPSTSLAEEVENFLAQEVGQ